MPELPEVEGVVRDLAPLVEGRTIKQLSVSDTVVTSKLAGKETIIKGKTVDDFLRGLEKMQISKIVRRSKYIYFHLQKGDQPHLLVSHLGMTGAWFVVDSPDDITEEKFRKHAHVFLEMEDGGLLVYSDIRRFGEMRLLQSEEDFPPLLEMAPEPFSDQALNHFLEMAQSPKYKGKAIKEVIMDGKVISGCGNIYATEALFHMKIHPARTAERISRKRKVLLFQEIVRVLQESIDAGGSTISDYRSVNGNAGTMQDRLHMYGKKVCTSCGKLTKSKQIAGRTSVYCSTCQK
ncbi:bifunctional DNA-formamidopyrimidine glycosylase/DNA-(apurinic or apyrimidinic site) lyase [Sporosarcina sp. GW1-11]|uniref:bifunctional DNA-formamidopyrimidine glycosylase/DNA-(apurinic or apyrimidinic site) lyase n=1 Tax=Sporosarcina sp. GW1-11 TaxID=2899126 RepID=UPI00294F34D6|nr:bifunctional DNA-formamidopyrimidine glycosylase/DNA-(apurinic or apyrimidinic site) lyase [Sporosarcina sp. GW1-11]MDV6377563.1 bifunctional DNA-formamidopyrimidine glycosylase/DNA-(apurinic or apyrimidinic site) lyase [Sporosarcina sp. GW1-11]